MFPFGNTVTPPGFRVRFLPSGKNQREAAIRQPETERLGAPWITSASKTL